LIPTTFENLNMKLPTFRSVILTLAVLASSSAWHTAAAHFVWLVPAVDEAGQIGETLEIYFGESAAPDDPDLLDLLAPLQLWAIAEDGQAQLLKPSRSADTLSLKLPPAANEKLFVAAQGFGVRDKGGAAYRLMYYAKSGPALRSPLWRADRGLQRFARGRCGSQNPGAG
jgi:hypothetical protein